MMENDNRNFPAARGMWTGQRSPQRDGYSPEYNQTPDKPLHEGAVPSSSTINYRPYSEFPPQMQQQYPRSVCMGRGEQLSISSSSIDHTTSPCMNYGPSEQYPIRPSHSSSGNWPIDVPEPRNLGASTGFEPHQYETSFNRYYPPVPALYNQNRHDDESHYARLNAQENQQHLVPNLPYSTELGQHGELHHGVGLSRYGPHSGLIHGAESIGHEMSRFGAPFTIGNIFGIDYSKNASPERVPREQTIQAQFDTRREDEIMIPGYGSSMIQLSSKTLSPTLTDIDSGPTECLPSPLLESNDQCSSIPDKTTDSDSLGLESPGQLPDNQNEIISDEQTSPKSQTIDQSLIDEELQTKSSIETEPDPLQELTGSEENPSINAEHTDHEQVPDTNEDQESENSPICDPAFIVDQSDDNIESLELVEDSNQNGNDETVEFISTDQDNEDQADDDIIIMDNMDNIQQHECSPEEIGALPIAIEVELKEAPLVLDSVHGVLQESQPKSPEIHPMNSNFDKFCDDNDVMIVRETEDEDDRDYTKLLGGGQEYSSSEDEGEHYDEEINTEGEPSEPQTLRYRQFIVSPNGEVMVVEKFKYKMNSNVAPAPQLAMKQPASISLLKPVVTVQQVTGPKDPVSVNILNIHLAQPVTNRQQHDNAMHLLRKGLNHNQPVLPYGDGTRSVLQNQNQVTESPNDDEGSNSHKPFVPTGIDVWNPVENTDSLGEVDIKEEQDSETEDLPVGMPCAPEDSNDSKQDQVSCNICGKVLPDMGALLDHVNDCQTEPQMDNFEDGPSFEEPTSEATPPVTSGNTLRRTKRTAKRKPSHFFDSDSDFSEGESLAKSGNNDDEDEDYVPTASPGGISDQEWSHDVEDDHETELPYDLQDDSSIDLRQRKAQYGESGTPDSKQYTKIKRPVFIEHAHESDATDIDSDEEFSPTKKIKLSGNRKRKRQTKKITKKESKTSKRRGRQPKKKPEDDSEMTVYSVEKLFSTKPSEKFESDVESELDEEFQTNDSEPKVKDDEIISPKKEAKRAKTVKPKKKVESSVESELDEESNFKDSEPEVKDDENKSPKRSKTVKPKKKAESDVESELDEEFKTKESKSEVKDDENKSPKKEAKRAKTGKPKKMKKKKGEKSSMADDKEKKQSKSTSKKVKKPRKVKKKPIKTSGTDAEDIDSEGDKSKSSPKKKTTPTKSTENQEKRIKGGGTQVCETCGKSVGNVYALQVHQKIHLGIKEFTCIYCKRSFAQRGQMMTHVRAVHERVKQFLCSRCARSFGSKSALCYHMESHMNKDYLIKYEQYVKRNDDNSFSLATGIPESEQEEGVVSYYCCIVCPRKHRRVILWLWHLKKHILLNDVPSQEQLSAIQKVVNECAEVLQTHKPHDCQHCGREYSTNKELNEHFRSSHGSERPHKCVICNSCFPTKNRLTNHEKTHLGKEMECVLCKTIFHSHVMLKAHILLKHDDTESDSCRCPECGFLFDKSQLETHVINAHNKKMGNVPLKQRLCKFCGKSFKTVDNLRVHQRTHTKERPYSCPLCEQRFSDPSNLIHHGKRKHQHYPQEIFRRRTFNALESVRVERVPPPMNPGSENMYSN